MAKRSSSDDPPTYVKRPRLSWAITTTDNSVFTVRPWVRNNRIRSLFRLTPTDPTPDYNLFLENLKGVIVPLIKQASTQWRGLKFHLLLLIKFHVPSKDAEDQEFPLNTNAMKLLITDDIGEAVDRVCAEVITKIDEYQDKKSGWVVQCLKFCDLYIYEYRPLTGGSFIKTPTKLANKKAIVNIQNQDDKCFVWSILAHMHPLPPESNAYRVAAYKKFENELDTTGMRFPVQLEDIEKFEKMNGLSINVYGYDSCLHPLYTTKRRDNPSEIIHLLLLTEPSVNGTRMHYCIIRDLSRLLHSETKHNGKKYFCPFCLCHYANQADLDGHILSCQADECRVEMASDPELRFTKYQNMMWNPVVVVCDIECYLRPSSTCLVDPDLPEEPFMESSTTVKARHIPNSYAAVAIHNCGCGEPEYKDFQLYRPQSDFDQPPIDHLLRYLLILGRSHQATVDKPVLLDMSEEDSKKFDEATVCSICEQPWNEETIVEEHCHICGKFRGAAHNSCNLNYRQQRDLVVMFHNLRRYDGHLIMQHIGSFAKKNNFPIDCIAKNMEDYLTFSLRVPHKKPNGKNISYKIKFVDSYQLLQGSLAELTSGLAEEDLSGEPHFRAMRSQFPDIELRKMLLCKQPYPYEYITGADKFLETSLPPRESFYNVLTMEETSEEDYRHAHRVWEKAGLRNLGDYNDIYLTCDVLLLADVVQSYREMGMTDYKLDLAHYISLPSYALDASLRHTNVKLELMMDQDMYQFMELGIRGGVSVISGRYAKANNKLMGCEYDPLQPTSFLIYVDANNLYGWAMSQKLPVGGFRWLNPDQVNNINTGTILKTTADDEEGYIYEVDLHIPLERHDYFNDYPLAPEAIDITPDMLSPYSKEMQMKFNLTSKPERKLTPNLFDKERYIVHQRNLKFYLKKGLVLTKVHRALQFKQQSWLKGYIDFNTSKRAAATTKFKQNFYKLLNNAVFGKSMENVRSHQDMHLVTDDEKLTKLVANPRFKYSKVFNDNLCAVAMRKEKIVLNKPVYTGFSILDISKELMFHYHYDYMKPTYGDKARLLFTDTDSFAYHVQTDNIYSDMSLSQAQWFDCSGYSKDHPLFDETNKKVIGKMKDEYPEGVVEFVGLASKMYSCRTTTGFKKVAKGVKKPVIKKVLTHEDYKTALFDNVEKRSSMVCFRSHLHNITTVEQVKKSLSPFDNKRFILPDGNFTLAHGHYKCDVNNIVTDNVNAVSIDE